MFPGINHSENLELNKFSNKVRIINQHCICILLKNGTETALTNPRVFTNYGKLYGSPQHTILPGEFACLGFYKTNFIPFGPEGVISYDLKDLGLTICIYFCNPFFGYNKFSMSWMKEGRNVDTDLCRALSSDTRNVWYAYGHMTWHDVRSETHDVMASGFIGEGLTAGLQVEVKKI